MHVAILSRKCDFARLTTAASRVPQEDLVTSMVFGTLQYLQPAEIVRFLATALCILRTPVEAQQALTQLAEAPEPISRPGRPEGLMDGVPVPAAELGEGTRLCIAAQPVTI